MTRNLLFVSKFCQTNNTSIEFLQTYFLAKDLQTVATLLKRPFRHGTYEWPVTSCPIIELLAAFLFVRLDFQEWHQRLGHPYEKTLKHIIYNCSIPVL